MQVLTKLFIDYIQILEKKFVFEPIIACSQKTLEPNGKWVITTDWPSASCNEEHQELYYLKMERNLQKQQRAAGH